MNRAAQELSSRLAAYGAKKSFAERVGIDQTVLSRWLSGERKPTLEQACRVEETEGIPVAWWQQPPVEGEAVA